MLSSFTKLNMNNEIVGNHSGAILISYSQ